MQALQGRPSRHQMTWQHNATRLKWAPCRPPASQRTSEEGPVCRLSLLRGRCPLQGLTEDGTGVWAQIRSGHSSPGSKLSTLSTPGGVALARKNLRKGLSKVVPAPATVGVGVGNPAPAGCPPSVLPPVAAKSTAPCPAARQPGPLSHMGDRGASPGYTLWKDCLRF